MACKSTKTKRVVKSSLAVEALALEKGPKIMLHHQILLIYKHFSMLAIWLCIKEPVSKE